MHEAYWLTPLIAYPVLAVYRLARKTGSRALLMVALQFAIMAAFDILVDCLYVIVSQDSLIDNALSDQYLVHSFAASAIQYNVLAFVLWLMFRGSRVRDTAGLSQRELRFVSLIVIVPAVFVLYGLIRGDGVQVAYGNAALGETIEGTPGSWGPIAFLVQLGTVYAVYCLMRGFEGSVLWRLAYFSSMLLVAIFAAKLLTGARAAVFTLIMTGLSAAILLRKKTRLLILSSGAVAVAMIGVFGVFSEVRGQRDRSVTMTPTEAAQELVGGIAASDGFDLGGLKDSIQQFAWRSAGARYGAVLMADVDTRGLVGVRSTVENLFAMVPRALWPERRFGNSRDGTASGMATYQVSQIITETSNRNSQSDSVSSAAVAYWMLGWPGVMASGIASALVVWAACGPTRSQQNSHLYTTTEFRGVLLLGITLGGWKVIGDVGGWLNHFATIGPVMLGYAALSGVLLRPNRVPPKNRGAVNVVSRKFVS